MPDLTPCNPLPDAEAFRAWLASALVTTGQAHSRVGVDLGLGRNTLRDFLVTPGRDLRLGTAALVAAHLTRAAAEKGAALPAFGAGANG